MYQNSSRLQLGVKENKHDRHNNKYQSSLNNGLARKKTKPITAKETAEHSSVA